jgi:RHS repeat-associated protein
VTGGSGAGDPLQRALRVRYTYGDDLVSQTRPTAGPPGSTARRYYHYDGQMSTRQLTGPPAQPGQPAPVTDTYTYDAFGVLTARTYTGASPTVNAYLYTGEQYDPNAGFYYLRARYYAQAIGRFTTRDPFEGLSDDPISLHRYLYANADPVDNADPSGLFTTADLGAVMHFAVVLINLYSAVTSTSRAISATIQAMRAFRSGDFWEGLGYAGVAVLQGAAAILSLLNLRSLPRPPGGAGTLAVIGGQTVSAEAFWLSAVGSPALIRWLLRTLGPPAFSSFLAIFSSAAAGGDGEGGSYGQGPVQTHHKIPFGNSSFNHQNHPLVRQAGVNLKSSIRNQMLLGNHGGRHSKPYHLKIKEWLDEGFDRVAGKGQAAALRKLNQIIDRIEGGIANGTLRPYTNKDVYIPPGGI